MVDESKGGRSGGMGAVGTSDVDVRRMKLWGAELGVVRRMDAMRVLECECCGGDSPSLLTNVPGRCPVNEGGGQNWKGLACLR